MLPRTYIYIMIMVSILSIAAFGLMNDGGKSLGVEPETNSSIYDMTDNIVDMTDNMQDKVRGGEASTIDFLDFIVNGAWEATILLLSVPTMFQVMIEETAIALGLGEYTWLISLVIYAIIVSVIFAVISSIFRRKT